MRAGPLGGGVLSSRSMPQRNAVSVLPDPVGASIRVCSPAAMAGHPSSWAWVGAGNEEPNHARTGSENRSRELMAAAYGAPPTPEPAGATSATNPRGFVANRLTRIGQFAFTPHARAMARILTEVWGEYVPNCTSSTSTS